MKRIFTANYNKIGRWYSAWIEEIPGVNTQGRTLSEAKENLKEALLLTLGTKHTSTIPRHKEINSFLVKKICRDLSIGEPKRN